MDTSAAFARISRNLMDAEKQTDATLLSYAELMATMLRARDNPAVAPHKGQQALHRLVRAQASVLEGSTNIFRVHEAMAEIGQELGMFGSPETGIFDEPKRTEPLAHFDEDDARKVA